MAPDTTSLAGPTLIGPAASLAETMRHADAPPRDTADPTVIGRYRVTGRLGAGAMGAVYAAHDESLDRPVAIKLMHRDDVPRRDERLLREAQAMAKLSHPNVAQVYEAGVHADHVFIAMELIHGITLGRWLAAAPRAFSEIVDKFVAAGRGLQAAHAAGVIHRDFKPDNVLVSDDGRVVVVDFGVAHLRRRLRLAPGPDTASDPGVADSSDGAVVGTPAYMSPEQWLGGQVDPRSDQFALCAALYEAVHGRRPFAGDSAVDLARNVLSGTLVPPPRPRRAPRWIDKPLTRGLQVHPERRFPTLAALLAELTRERQRRTRRWVLAIGGLALAGGLGFAASTLQQDDPCVGAGDRVHAVWNDERRAALTRTLVDESRHAADTWQRVDEHLGAYANTWAQAARDACAATRIRNEASEELLDQRSACLSTRLRALGAVVATFEHAGAAALDHAVEALAGLPAIAPCSDADYVRAAIPPPPTAALAAAVEAVRDRLARARAGLGTLEPRAQLADVTALVAEAEALAYLPLLAEARALHGAVLTQIDRGTGDAELERAYASASASGHDEVAFDAALNLAAAAEYAVGGPWLVVAEALLTRLHADDFQQARYHYIRLYRACSSRGCDLPVDDLVAAIARHRRNVGEHHPTLAQLLGELANIHMLRRDEAEAERVYAEALALRESLLGPLHPRLVSSLGNLARLALLRDDPGAAAPYIRRISEILGDDFSPENPFVLALRQLESDLALHNFDLEAAAEFLARGLAEAHGKQPPRMNHLHLQLAEIRRLLGRRDEALAGLVAADFTTSPPALQLDAAAHAAELTAELGDDAATRAHLAAARPLLATPHELTIDWQLTLAGARLAARDGSRDAAVRDLEALLAAPQLTARFRGDAHAALAAVLLMSPSPGDRTRARTHAAAADAAYAEAGRNYQRLRDELATLR